MYALTAFKNELKRILNEHKLITLDEAMAMAEESEVVRFGETMDHLSHYICDDDTEQAYQTLLGSSPETLAHDVVMVWEPFDHYTVKEILDLI